MPEDSYKPPKGAQEAAKKAIRWKEEHGDEVKAMTQVGWVRARQLANGDNLSYKTVRRMAAFNRHKSNSKINPEFEGKPWKDNGYVAWLGWGGDTGINWAMNIVDRVNREKKESTNLSSFKDFLNK